MLQIEIVDASYALGSGSASKNTYNGIDTYCIIKFIGKEIGRTSTCLNTMEPMWNETFFKTFADLNSKERPNNRPFFLEYLELEIYEAKSNADKHVKLYETRVPLTNIGNMKGYKLLKPLQSASTFEYSLDIFDNSKINIKLVIPNLKDWFYHQDSFDYAYLKDVLSPYNIKYRHLYLDYNWTPYMFTYRSGLPGPTTGEVLIDKYDYVEWITPTITNAFGDKLSVTCHGQLFITDLRIIFLPYELIFPFQSDIILLTEDMKVHDTNQITYLHKYTIQIPIPALADCKVSTPSVPSNGASSPTSPSQSYSLAGLDTQSRVSLTFDTIDHTHLEFIVKKASNRASQRSHRTMVVEFDQLHEKSIQLMNDRLLNIEYRSGLETTDLDPMLWVQRIVDYLWFELRLDLVWLRWAKYLKQSFQTFQSSVDKAWLRKAMMYNTLDSDYQRHYVQDLDWRFSDLNEGYDICPTYPSTLVFPGNLSDEDIRGAAAQRSIGRLPALVWLHANTKAPLCRASQPLAGLSGTSLELDKKMCVSIKNSCPSGLPLRIADARPKLNANANAVQGKGFENIAFMGGPSVASLIFLDIENIHVMRNSLYKAKDGLEANGEASSVSGTMAAATFDSNVNNLHASKWSNHIASVLRGAMGIADSLMIGHPVLVHCSDGWDRTAQLSSLAQLMLDPYYRTIEGFLVLIQREWCSFGHKFEDRLGRSGHSKEKSPVFIQMLDATWQLLHQYPTSFEFTGHFLTILMECLYSGFFFTFRANCELDRMKLQRNVLSLNEITSDELEYGNLNFYIHSLLRCNNIATLVMNANYRPPLPHEKQIQYLRPRCGNVDIDVWREGLFGWNFNIIELSSQAEIPPVNVLESHAVTNDMFGRYMSYLDLHLQSMDVTIQQNIEIMKSTPYPCPSFPENYYGQHATLNYLFQPGKTLRSITRNDCKQAVKSQYKFRRFHKAYLPSAISSVSFVENEDSLEREEDVKRESSIIRLQLWWRTYLSTKRTYFLIQQNFGENNPKPWNELVMRKVANILASSYWKSFFYSKQEITSSHITFIHRILDNIVIDVVDRAIRSDFAIRKYHNFIQSQSLSADKTSLSTDSLSSPSNYSTEYSPTSAKMSLSSLLKTFSKPSNSSNPYEDSEDFALSERSAIQEDFSNVKIKDPNKKKTFTSRMLGIMGSK